LLQATQIEALKRTVREYERQLQQYKLAAEEERKRVEADRLFALKQVVVAMMMFVDCSYLINLNNNRCNN
jgi:hypothetical protein